MPKTTVRIEGADELKAKFEALGKEARGPTLARAGQQGAEVIRDLARTKAPGPYIDLEIEKQTEFAILFNIGPDKDHWYYQFAETGAGPHPIGPKSGEAIRFTGREGEILRWAVAHPGHAADPFLRPAIETGQDAATKAIAAELRAGIARVAGG